MRQASIIGVAIAAWTYAFAPADRAYAQVTAEQQGAIRAHCRSDFMAKCSGVTPGGKDALVCLQKNVAGLSAACKTAVSATIPAPAAPAPAPAAAAAPPQPPPPPPAPAAAAAPAPKPSQSTVKSAPPPRATLPTRSAAPKPAQALPPQALSPQALPQQAPPSPPPPAPPPQQAVVVPPAAPPPPATRRPNAPVVMTAVIGRACLRDLALHCRNTGVGDGQKIACLTARGDRLAPLCKAALKGTAPIR